jgi:hypothetical protein
VLITLFFFFFCCEFKGTHFGFILFGYLGFGSLDV